jgi:hypothetical protein
MQRHESPRTPFHVFFNRFGTGHHYLLQLVQCSQVFQGNRAAFLPAYTGLHRQAPFLQPLWVPSRI